MNTWPPAGTAFFNPHPTIQTVAIGPGQQCLVIDDVLADPEALVRWAEHQPFAPAQGVPYPGLMVPAGDAISHRTADFFTSHLRKLLGARRVLETNCRLSLVTTPPGQLSPCQWQCHRDRIAADPQQTMFAASVLYLFRNPAMGGTSFYTPRKPREQIEQMVDDSLRMDAPEFSQRYGLQAGYMTSSNDYFEKVATVPAAWNRLVFYDGGLFHSGDVDDPALLSSHPGQGRLTLNAFVVCRREAR